MLLSSILDISVIHSMGVGVGQFLIIFQHPDHHQKRENGPQA